MAYAKLSDVTSRMTRTLSATEQTVATKLLEDASVIIDAYNEHAAESAKALVACRMVIRALGDGQSDYPVGATQGSMSGLGYAQSWTISGGGSVSEVYLTRTEKKLLGVSNQIGSYSPVQGLAGDVS